MDAGELGAHLDAELEVEVGQRLVHEERPRAPDQRAGQRDALLLAARHLRGPALQQALDVQQVRHLLDRGGDLPGGRATRAQRRGDVLVGRARG